MNFSIAAQGYELLVYGLGWIRYENSSCQVKILPQIQGAFLSYSVYEL
jgi:hypothetical protein